jgi:sugar/nucleoside kinase (ribokinase family)
MGKKYDVLAIGDLCVDLILKGKDIVPEFGQKEKLIDSYSLEMGGSGTIFSCQIAKLGLKAVVAGKAGKDTFGDLIIGTLAASGVNTDYIKSDASVKTGITVALNKIDDRAMLTYTGTIDEVGIEDVSLELLSSARHFHISSYFLMKKIQPHYPDIIKILKGNGTTISLDTNWDPEESWKSGIWDILPYVDIFFPNENEAKAITGMNDTGKALKILGGFVPVIAVKKGMEGAVTYAGANSFHAPSVSTVKIDAVGAGDSFNGGFIYGFLNGMNLETCTKIGCICGSLSTRAAGGTKAQPDLHEVQEFLAI